MRLQDILEDSYAQYDRCLFITGTPKRKRSNRRYILRPYEQFTLYSGWVDINNIENIVTENDEIKVVSLGLCFSEDTLRKSIENIDNKVLLKGNI